MFRQRFSDPALQAEYEASLASERVQFTRLGVALATLLNVSFSFLDVWAAPSAYVEFWQIRLVMNAVLLGCLAMTFSRDFQRVYPWVVATLYLSLGSGINLMVLLAGTGDLAAEAYYGGLLLTTIGIYALTSVRLHVSLGISMVLLVQHAAVCLVGHNFIGEGLGVVLFANLWFFVGATVLGVVAQAVRDRYTRENFLLRHSLERNVEIQEMEKRRVAYLAEHDALTGLPNRLQFDRLATQILAGAVRDEKTVALFFIDLNRFKPVNDTHGHAAGDKVLEIIGQRLRNVLRQGDAVARLGGDEFVACTRIDGDVAPLLRKLLDAIEAPISLREANVSVSASIGVATSPGDGTDVDELLACADSRMYERKPGAARLQAAR